MKRIKISFLFAGVLFFSACNNGAKPSLVSAESEAPAVMKDRCMVSSGLTFANNDNEPVKLDSLALEFSVNGKPSGKSRAISPDLEKDYKQVTLRLLSVFSPEEILGMEDKELIGKLFSEQGVDVKINIKGKVFMTKEQSYEVPVDYTAKVNLKKNISSQPTE